MFHDMLRWPPSLISLGVAGIILAATVGIVWLLAAPLARFVVWCALQLFFKIRIVGANRFPKTGGR